MLTARPMRGGPLTRRLLPAIAFLLGLFFRALPGRLVGQVESRSRYGDLDRAATRAVSDEMNYAATLSLEVPEGGATHRFRAGTTPCARSPAPQRRPTGPSGLVVRASHHHRHEDSP